MATTAKTSTETRKKPPPKTAATEARKTAAKKPAAKRAVAKAPAAPKAGKPAISAAKRRHYIEVAAYYIAERRGFAGGSAADDWRTAEAEIDLLLAEGKLNGA